MLDVDHDGMATMGYYGLLALRLFYDRVRFRLMKKVVVFVPNIERLIFISLFTSGVCLKLV